MEEDDWKLESIYKKKRKKRKDQIKGRGIRERKERIIDSFFP